MKLEWQKILSMKLIVCSVSLVIWFVFVDGNVV